MAVAGLKDTVADLFSGNPFATEVGHRIEQASDPKLGSENWALFMEICDLINENEDSAKDAARAIKKRLQVVMQAKDFEAVQLVLTILETCVKNCGKRFHTIVCSRDYVSELMKLIGVKYEPPVVVQDRVLGLVQNWAETFRSSPDLHGVTEVYDEHKARGVDFPVLDLETMTPIITPQRTVTAAPQPIPVARRASLNPQLQQQQQQQVQHPHITNQEAVVQPASQQLLTGPVNLTPEQLAKLRGEVDIVKSNMQIFSEMLGEMKPGQEEQDDLQLLLDLHTTIRSMQDRVAQLLGMISNEEVTGELLAVNDEMNALFMRYERYERQRKGANIQTRALPQVPSQVREPSTLIDFSESGARHRTDDVVRQMETMRLDHPQHQTQVNEPPDFDNEDFGAFALSRVAKPTVQPPPPATQHVSSVPNHEKELPKENELEEMENWLKAQPEMSSQHGGERPSLSSSEFDRFLESRAIAAEQLPSIPANRGSNEKPGSKEETSHLLDS